MGKPLDSTKDHRISLKEASELARRHRQDGAHRAGDSGAFNGKPVMELLSQPGCVGLRIYRGRAAGGESSLILVGVDAKGNDMTEGVVLDGHFPCPPYCGDDNALNS
ncbi:MAG: hypothetical protein K8S21_04380 [Gemmatimonadetes bacterium]|nr:hypothetical protein [Gemmatimonadota bacterium]